MTGLAGGGGALYGILCSFATGRLMYMISLFCAAMFKSYVDIYMLCSWKRKWSQIGWRRVWADIEPDSVGGLERNRRRRRILAIAESLLLSNLSTIGTRRQHRPYNHHTLPIRLAIRLKTTKTYVNAIYRTPKSGPFLYANPILFCVLCRKTVSQSCFGCTSIVGCPSSECPPIQHLFFRLRGYLRKGKFRSQVSSPTRNA